MSKTTLKGRTGPNPVKRKVVLKDGTKGTLSANQVAFLSAFRECGVLCRAADTLGFSRSIHSYWTNPKRKQSEFYKAAYREVLEEVADELEAVARERAIDGVRSIKFTKNGDPIQDPRKLNPDGSPKPEWIDDPWYYDHQYSDRLLELLLRAKRPEEFRDRVSQEVSGPGGKPMELDIAARQIALANPELSQQMCLALENVESMPSDDEQDALPAPDSPAPAGESDESAESQGGD